MARDLANTDQHWEHATREQLEFAVRVMTGLESVLLKALAPYHGTPVRRVAKRFE